MATIVAPDPRGLSEREAEARAARGERNVLPPPTGRTYGEILRENALTFVNLAILAIGIALALMGEPSDALVSIGVVAVNVIVGVVQEIRAKIVLDRIALLVRPLARVLRDGIERDVAASDLVVGDVVRVAAGDQILADGVVVSGGPLEMDESLLTGESAAALRGVGDEVRSGTFCLAGAAIVETRLVGEASLANRLTVGARAFRRVATPLQRRVDLIIRAVLLVAVSFTLVLIGSMVVERGDVVAGLKAAMVIAGLVPNGLVLAASAAYAMSGVRVARRGVLVQQANAIDSLSQVDVLCMDKTGTLTTGDLRCASLDPLGTSAAELRRLAGRFAATVSAPDRTIAAMAATCPAPGAVAAGEVPFSAARRWSGVAFGDEDGAIVFGAPERLLPHLDGPSGPVATLVDERTAAGLRVLLLARSEGLTPADPGRLRPLGIVCFEEDVRRDARATIERFAGAGIAVKIISGDHPNTVRAIAKASGVGGEVATGDVLDGTDDEALGPLLTRTTVFARTTPQQKERILRALRRDGHYAAMVGDGINDVLALKAANLGVALRSGAPSARAVADMVLLHDEIGALVPAATEGRRILRGMRDILRIFLARVLYAALVIAAVAAIEGGFPLSPKQNALLTLLTVGIPSLFLAAWAPAERIARDDLGQGLARMVVPAGWTIAVAAFVTYVAATLAPARVDVPAQTVAQSALTTMCVLCGLIFFVFVEDAAGPNGLRRRHRPRLALAAILLAAYALILALPNVASSLDLVTPNASEIVAIVSGALLWIAALRWLLRVQALDALLGVPRDTR